MPHRAPAAGRCCTVQASFADGRNDASVPRSPAAFAPHAADGSGSPARMARATGRARLAQKKPGKRPSPYRECSAVSRANRCAEAAAGPAPACAGPGFCGGRLPAAPAVLHGRFVNAAYSFLLLAMATTTPLRASRPIRLGRTIRPLNMSDMFHTRLTFSVEPMTMNTTTMAA